MAESLPRIDDSNKPPITVLQDKVIIQLSQRST